MFQPVSGTAKLEARRGRSTPVHFSVSVPGSESSSRAPSPAPLLQEGGGDLDLRRIDDIYIGAKVMRGGVTTSEIDVTPGRRPMDVYDTTLPWWRAAIRRKLVKTVQWESRAIARMQVGVFWVFLPC